MTPPSRREAVIVVEPGPGPLREAESNARAFLSAAVTLTLGILGSSILPVPYAYSRSSVAVGLIVAFVVAAFNTYTGTLLLRAAAHLQEVSYEGVAEAVGGRAWKGLSQLGLIVLLWGTLCGDFALLADTGRISLEVLLPDAAPAWLSAGNGRVIMALLAVAVVFPLSCLRQLRQLELAAIGGVGLVAVLVGVVVWAAAAAGFPAIASGELPLVRVPPAAARQLPEAVAVLSFAFYLQPLLLPLLKEMPAGRAGVDITVRATQMVTMGVAYLVYGLLGVFAAARYGLATEGDVIVNQWLPGRWDGALDAAIALYLSVAMAPMCMALRIQLDSLLVGDAAPYLPRRDVLLTAGCLGSSLAVALAFPTSAERIFAVTGATAVCLVCYVIPVMVHLRLYFRGWRYRLPARRPGAGGGGGEARRWLLDPAHGVTSAEPHPRPPSPALAGAAPAQARGVHRGAQSDVSLDSWLRLSHDGGGGGGGGGSRGSPTSSAAPGPDHPTLWATGSSMGSLPELPGLLLAAPHEGSAAGLALAGLRGRGRGPKAGAASEPCGYPSWRGGRGRGPASRAWLSLRHVVLPVAVLVVGVGFSVSALWLAVASWRHRQ